MMMPGRNTEYSWSRMGYNGQAKDDEVYGKGNLNTALYWEMDTRILRRWNLDPKDQVSISNYAIFANSPILYNDVLGDKFKVGTDQNSKDDITSIVSSKFKDAVKIDDKTGDVSINYDSYKKDFANKDGTFNQKGFDKFVKKGNNDPGISIINGMVNAKRRSENGVEIDENYFYAASYEHKYYPRDGSSPGTMTYYPGQIIKIGSRETGGFATPIANLSVTKEMPDDAGDLPAPGFHGSVMFAPGIPKVNGQTVPRSGVVYHELRENFIRTHFGKYYDFAHPNAGGIGEISTFEVK